MATGVSVSAVRNVVGSLVVTISGAVFVGTHGTHLTQEENVHNARGSGNRRNVCAVISGPVMMIGMNGGRNRVSRDSLARQAVQLKSQG